MKLLLFLTSVCLAVEPVTYFAWYETPESEARLKEERKLIRDFEDKDSEAITPLRFDLGSAQFEALSQWSAKTNEDYQGPAIQKSLLTQAMRSTDSENLIEKALRIHPLRDYELPESGPSSDVFEARILKHRTRPLCELSFLGPKPVALIANGFSITPEDKWTIPKGRSLWTARFEDGGLGRAQVNCSKEEKLTLRWEEEKKIIPLLLLQNDLGRRVIIQKGLGVERKQWRFNLNEGLLPLAAPVVLAKPEVQVIDLQPQFEPALPIAFQEPDGQVETKWYNDWKFWTVAGGAVATIAYFAFRPEGEPESPAGRVTITGTR